MSVFFIAVIHLSASQHLKAFCSFTFMFSKTANRCTHLPRWTHTHDTRIQKAHTIALILFISHNTYDTSWPHRKIRDSTGGSWLSICWRLTIISFNYLQEYCTGKRWKCAMDWKTVRRLLHYSALQVKWMVLCIIQWSVGCWNIEYQISSYCYMFLSSWKFVHPLNDSWFEQRNKCTEGVIARCMTQERSHSMLPVSSEFINRMYTGWFRLRESMYFCPSQHKNESALTPNK
jgi:hypothetical protein